MVQTDTEQYNDWLETNEEDLIESWLDTYPEAPESVYEGVLDDDGPDAYDAWAESVRIDDVDEDFLLNEFEKYNEEGHTNPLEDRY